MGTRNKIRKNKREKKKENIRKTGESEKRNQASKKVDRKK